MISYGRRGTKFMALNIYADIMIDFVPLRCLFLKMIGSGLVLFKPNIFVVSQETSGWRSIFNCCFILLSFPMPGG